MKFNLRTIRRLNVFIAGGLSGMYFFSNSYLLESVKNKLELKINNVPAPVSPKIKKLVNDVMDDMDLSGEQKSLINVFMINDFHLKHLGYANEKFGVYLGVPQHFILDKESDFDVLPMVENTELREDSPEAWNLKHALALSKDAKKFALASEIYEAKHKSFYLMGLLPTYVLLQANAVSIISERLFKIWKKTMPFFQSLVFIMALEFYILLSDIINNYTQADAEYMTARLGTSYIEGGIEYYEKIMERNKVIKKLNKNASYTEEGEFEKHMGFRTPTLPLERRIRLLKDLKNSQQLPKEKENPLKYVL